MRRIFVMCAAALLVCAVAATTAWALTNNTVKYQAKLSKKGKPSKRHPARLGYEGILDVGTTDGSQPNVAPDTTIYYARQIVQNAKYFPKCNPASNQTNPNGLDGATTVPKSCKKAVIGKGTATAYPGSPGGPLGAGLGLKEDLKVTAYNGLHGKQILLALNGSSPQIITNRVIIGTIGKGKGRKFSYSVNFHVPDNLQVQAGFQIALTHFDVKISKKAIKAKVHHKRKKLSYLGLTSCPKNHKLPVETTVHLSQDGTPGSQTAPPPGGQVLTSKSTMKC
jgi:hypothetical protein